VATRGVGIDVVDVERFALAIERHPALVGRLFTDAEQRDASSRPERLAARFAAKEAVLKTLHVGVGATSWHSIEIHRDPSGAPSVRLHGSAAALAHDRGVSALHLSMTHTRLSAAAVVVASDDGAVDAG